MNSEVLIIGGGVIGLTIARELHKKGAGRITIIDRGPIGSEASWAAAGMLAPNIETDTSDDFHRFGTESLELYPDLSASLLEETGVDVELDRSGTLCLAFNEAERAELDETYQQQNLRSVPVVRLSADDVRYLEPSVSSAASGGLFYPSDWQIENRKLLAALKKFAESNGIRIVENTEVSELMTDGRRIVGARTAAGEMKAHVTVLATGAWTSLIKIGDAFLPVSVQPIRGQMISFSTGKRLVRRVVYSHRGYIVPRADGRVLVGATVEDVGFAKSTTAEGVASLKDAAEEIAPCLQDFEITERWAGLRPFVADGLPVLGEIPAFENIFIATAHYRNGILLAPKTAQLIAERIVDGVNSKVLELYGVGRFAAAANANAK
jgi:glycine oxidase